MFRPFLLFKGPPPCQGSRGDPNWMFRPFWEGLTYFNGYLLGWLLGGGLVGITCSEKNANVKNGFIFPEVRGENKTYIWVATT